MIMKNFQRHYNTNRAPFGLSYHPAWSVHFLIIRLFLAHFSVRIKCGRGKLEYILKLKLLGWLSEEVVKTMRETSGVCLQGLIRVHNACSSCVSSIVLHRNGLQTHSPTFNLEHCTRLCMQVRPHLRSTRHYLSQTFSPPRQQLTLACLLFVCSFNCVSHIAMLL